VPLFAGLNKRQLAQVAAIAEDIDLRQGHVLIQEGDRGREFFAVIEGEVEVRRGGQTIFTGGAGDFFGEIALVTDVPRTATVTATTPVRALVIRDKEFRTLLQRTPEVALKVLETVAERVPADH
jgi:CRP-like cAMP-binding protein